MDETVQRIISELKIQGKSQVELANFLGISQNAITDWKSGRIKSYTKYIYAIAEFLGVSVEYLRGETSDDSITVQRIFDEMSKKKIHQKDLAVFLGISGGAIGNWKAGLNTSYTKYIYAIAEFLGVSVEYLRGETDIKQKHLAQMSEVHAGVRSISLSPHEQTVITAYREQPEMQPAVDRLLNLTPKVVELRTAAGGGGVSADSVPLSVEDLARAQAAAEDASSDGE